LLKKEGRIMGSVLAGQSSFSRLWSGFSTDAEAKSARDKVYREARKRGLIAKRWVLKNQLRQYESFGVPDSRVCDVFMLNIYEEDSRDGV
jgi:hypothetical protein